MLGVPAVSLEALQDVLSEGHLGVAINGDVVVIVDGNEVAELQVAGQRSSLASNTFLCTAVTKEHVRVVGDQIEARLVEQCAGVCLSDSKTNGVGEALTQGACCYLDTGGVVRFGVARGDAVHLLLCIRM